MSGRVKAILESDSEVEQDDDQVQQEDVDPESPDPEPEQELEHDQEQASEQEQKQDEHSESSDSDLEALKTSKDYKKPSLEDDEESDNDDEERKSPIQKGRIVESDDEDEDEEEEEEDEDDKDGKDNTETPQPENEDEEDSKEVEQPDNEEDEGGVLSDEEDDHRRPSINTTLYDFDIMMAKKKEENSRKRKRRNYDIINDNDDIIADIINQMKDAVEADSEANKNKMAATRKLKLLPFVISQLRKVDLRDAFLDSDVLSVITEWLAPLPDRSLPHLNIRDSLLKILIDFNLYDVDRIKGSGIGKAIMYLYKHPKETRENKQRAKQLISCWSRPIFQLDSSFNSISREEREQRDLELMSKQRRASRHDDSPESDRPGPSSGPKKKEDGAQKPGDKGWIPRARVPAPSMRDYVIRPRSKVDGDVGKNSKRPANMLEKYMKNQQERRRANRQQRAINMKIDRV